MATNLRRFDPFGEMVSLREAMDRLLQGSFVHPEAILPASSETLLPLDVSENENAYVVHASLPGIKPENVQIALQGNTLTIRSQAAEEKEDKGTTYLLRERRQSASSRTITLPGPIDADRVETRFEHGVLTLTLPKGEAAKPKKIAVRTSR